MKKISEIDIIKLFQNKIGHDIIDDIGITEFEDKTYAFNIDTFVKSTDAPTSMDYMCIGWKSIVSTISDLYVKGVIPEGILISLGISRDDLNSINNLSIGIRDIVKKYNLKIVKWDTNSARDLFITVCGFGEVMYPIPWRSNMQLGDYIVVSDYFGLEGLGLKIMLGKIKDIEGELSRIAIDKFCKPSPEFNKYIEIVSKGVHASIDSSDGLARSLWLLSEASNLKVRLFKIPVHPLINSLHTHRDFKLSLALHSGEEYIGVFSIPKEYISLAKNIGFIPIGEVIEEGIGVYFNNNIIENKGWLHTF